MTSAGPSSAWGCALFWLTQGANSLKLLLFRLIFPDSISRNVCTLQDIVYKYLLFHTVYAIISLMEKHFKDIRTPYIKTGEIQKPNYTLRRLGALVATLALVIPAYRLTAEAYDKLTTDDVTYSTTANIVPNPTQGGQEALQELIGSGTAEERQAAQHVDIAELGSKIAEEVVETTGQSPRQITNNVPVAITFEADGDITNVDVIPEQ